MLGAIAVLHYGQKNNNCRLCTKERHHQKEELGCIYNL